MSATSMETGVVLDTTGAIGLRRFVTRGTRFITEVFDGADEALAALETIQGGLVSTGFQSLDWLTVLYEELAPAKAAMPRVVVVTERNTGQIALVLPLLVQRKKLLDTAKFADLGVSSYGGPILGPAFPTKARSIRRTWRSILRAMPDVDLIRLERMPAEIGGRPNPLLTRSGIAPSRRSGCRIYIEDSVEDYVASLGSEQKRDFMRRERAWEKEGGACFYRASEPEAIARVFTVLQELEAARYAATGAKYKLDQPPYRAFYERLAIDGAEAGVVCAFALEARGEIVAGLLGLLHDETFTILRRADLGKDCRHFSPGRLIVIEVMKYFVARGVRRFDLGVGDDLFQNGFGGEEVPLYDLIIARELAAVPRAAFHRVKGRLRKNARVRAVFERVRPYIGV